MKPTEDFKAVTWTITHHIEEMSTQLAYRKTMRCIGRGSCSKIQAATAIRTDAVTHDPTREATAAATRQATRL